MLAFAVGQADLITVLILLAILALVIYIVKH